MDTAVIKRSATRAALVTLFVFGYLGYAGYLSPKAADKASDQDKQVVSVSFSDTPAPITADEMATTRTTSIATLTYDDGTTQTYPLSYHRLFGVTDKIGKYAAGQLFDRQMMPLKDPSGAFAIAETPDGNSLLSVADNLYLVTHYEYDWLNGDGSKVTARMPMTMTLTKLEQAQETGQLTATGQYPINFSATNGIWIPCFASQTPWNTHLGSEEDYDLQYSPAFTSAPKKDYDSVGGTLAGIASMRDVYGHTQATPYHYGFLTEVVVSAEGKTTPIKHYGMGRGTWEMGKIMPDGKTVYFGDDGNNSMMMMFIAQVAGDLSKGGILYAARWEQTSEKGANGGEANLSWIKLGSSQSNDQIKALADTETFADLFTIGQFDAQTQRCSGQTQWIRAGSAFDECLAVKPDKAVAAAFLESRRMAALKGATVEFTKMEGIALNAADNRLYIAMSSIRDGMKAVSTAPTDHIQLKENKAGAVYRADLKGNVRDAQGDLIPSNHVATRMAVEVDLMGEPITPDALGNTAHPDKIANPDNLFFSEKMRTLFIGEDSGMHVNNFIWAYHIDRKQLSRILSVPVGAETSGLQVIDDLNGHAYIMNNSQHHGDWAATQPAEVASALKKIDKFNANVGYLGGLPAIK